MDDYLTKPFSVHELAARVRALLRRPPTSLTQVLTVGGLALDSKLGKVTLAGKDIALLPKELALLEFLMRHKGQMLRFDRKKEKFTNSATANQMFESVWLTVLSFEALLFTIATAFILSRGGLASVAWGGSSSSGRGERRVARSLACRTCKPGGTLWP